MLLTLSKWITTSARWPWSFRLSRFFLDFDRDLLNGCQFSGWSCGCRLILSWRMNGWLGRSRSPLESQGIMTRIVLRHLMVNLTQRSSIHGCQLTRLTSGGCRWMSKRCCWLPWICLRMDAGCDGLSDICLRMDAGCDGLSDICLRMDAGCDRLSDISLRMHAGCDGLSDEPLRLNGSGQRLSDVGVRLNH